MGDEHSTHMKLRNHQIQNSKPQNKQPIGQKDRSPNEKNRKRVNASKRKQQTRRVHVPGHPPAVCCVHTAPLHQQYAPAQQHGFVLSVRVLLLNERTCTEGTRAWIGACSDHLQQRQCHQRLCHGETKKISATGACQAKPATAKQHISSHGTAVHANFRTGSQERAIAPRGPLVITTQIMVEQSCVAAETGANVDTETAVSEIREIH